MEPALQKRGEQQESRDSRMGGEEMADSGFIEEDANIELDSGFSLEVDSELSLAERRESDCFEITEHGDSRGERRAGLEGPGGIQEEGEMEAGSRVSDAETGVEIDEETEEEEEEEAGGALDVCLRPVQESGGPVRISLEEVERYYRFSRRCRWLCGRCPTVFTVLVGEEGYPCVLCSTLSLWYVNSSSRLLSYFTCGCSTHSDQQSCLNLF